MSILRISGIASGIDTDQFVADLMKVERMKVDRLVQQRQILTWQKEQYRNITNEVRKLRDHFFNAANLGTNLMSEASLKKMTAESSDSQTVQVQAGSSALSGSHSFSVIESALAARAQKVNVTGNSDTTLDLSDTLEDIGQQLAEGFSFADDALVISINEETFTFHKTDTLQSVFRIINQSEADIDIHYSTFSDAVTAAAGSTGEKAILTDDGGGFFSALGLTLTEKEEGLFELGEKGRDARFTINGVEGKNSRNTFTIDGVTYSLQKEIHQITEEIDIAVSVDTEAIFQTVTDFVQQYNELISFVNEKLAEERHRDFPPLTDTQKEAMSDREIEQWENMAQSGLLRSDTTLQGMLRAMRDTLYSSVDDLHLTQIGIRTSSNYKDRGKLVLDNNGLTLKKAIENQTDKMVRLFGRRSDIRYDPDLTSAQRQQRFEESGLAQRFNDVLQNYIRITRNQQGQKGLLLERAGIEGDLSEYSNTFDARIAQVNSRMEQVNAMLARKEEQYYRQFSAMEQALQQLYAQGDWLMAQLNGPFTG